MAENCSEDDQVSGSPRLHGGIARYLSISFIGMTMYTIINVLAFNFLFGAIEANNNDALTRSNLALLGLQVQVQSHQLLHSVQDYIAENTLAAERISIRREVSATRTEVNQIFSQAVEMTTEDDLTERTQLANIERRFVDAYLQTNRVLQSFDQEQASGTQTQQLSEQLHQDYIDPLARQILEFQDYEAGRIQEDKDRNTKIQRILSIVLPLSGLMVVLLTGWVTYRAFNRIILPLIELSDGVEQMRHGKLNQPINIEAEDEIGELADTLNRMAAQLNATLAGLQLKVEELNTAKEALERSEQHYRSLYDGVPVGLFRSTREGRILEVNDRLVQMLHFPDKETLLATSAFNLYTSSTDREQWLTLSEKQDGVIAYDSPMRCLDGAIIWARRNVQAVTDPDGAVLYFEGSLEDTTEIKQAEEEIRLLNTELERRVILRTAELEAANRELESFAYSVSHDLRAPLRSIDGYSKLLMEDYAASLDEQSSEYLHNVRISAQRMSQIIEDILNLSRVTRAEMTRATVDMSAMAREVLGDLHKRQPERRVVAELHEPLTAEGDPNLLYLLLQNLVGNAWKFTSKQTQAYIELGAIQQEGQKIYFVSDNGAGFDMRYVNKLFLPFQRLHQQDEYEGTGIGLATVQRIVQRHGGRVWAEGQVDQGATFYFTLK